jgi:hypothetical protein
VRTNLEISAGRLRARQCRCTFVRNSSGCLSMDLRHATAGWRSSVAGEL